VTRLKGKRGLKLSGEIRLARSFKTPTLPVGKKKTSGGRHGGLVREEDIGSRHGGGRLYPAENKNGP